VCVCVCVCVCLCVCVSCGVCLWLGGGTHPPPTQVWRQYAETARALLRDGACAVCVAGERATRSGGGGGPKFQVTHALHTGGRIIGSTICENAALMLEVLSVRPVPFQPSIPHLVYQYDFYTGAHPARAPPRCPGGVL
jgi:hypothetical protein